MPVDRSVIRVKAMLIALDADRAAHLVSLNRPTAEEPEGHHRLVGGSVELGETARDAVVREVDEELGAVVEDLRHLASVESIFRIDGELGHEVVFLFAGRLDPAPPAAGGTLTEIDGSVVPVVWRPVDDSDEPLPLYPAAAVPWVRRLAAGTDAAAPASDA